MPEDADNIIHSPSMWMTDDDWWDMRKLQHAVGDPQAPNPQPAALPLPKKTDPSPK